MFAPFVLAGVLFCAPVLARADEGAVLTVKVEHIAKAGGNLRLAIYNAKSFPNDNADPIVDKVVTATPSVQTVELPAVPPGVYAVKMFQDVNRNEKFDFNWLGIPSERYGFSNNARPNWFRMSAPTFEEAKIELKPGTNRIEIWLH